METPATYSGPYHADESMARELDAADPLRRFRERFHIPPRPDGTPTIYFCGHSLGLQPKAARALVEQELDAWANRGVEGHFRGKAPWYPYHENFRDMGARLVGGRPCEVVFMNSLTANLHLMLLTFYRPTRERFRILTDEPTFPSDRYALTSQLRHHGFDADGLLTIAAREGESTIRIEDIEELLDRRGHEIRVVVLNGVNFFTGQWFDMSRITAAAHRHGCIVGFDLAHAAGNVPLSLHDWGVDFAVWCTYKYLNCGPGAVGGCFVHERHGNDLGLPRLAGWWGNDPATRFRMHLEPDFVPRAGADGWQLSNPPILAMAPLFASLALFDEVGMPALRAKSACLTAYLQFLLDQLPPGRFEVLTPRDPRQRGAMLSILDHRHPKELVRLLVDEGVVCDFREPNVIRVAPMPLYNTFHEVWRFAQLLARRIGE
ncbi:MAG: kynureninase [Gemmataceae bacterium]|nr:kynureninase [Gemmataceae bacterium]